MTTVAQASTTGPEPAAEDENATYKSDAFRMQCMKDGQCPMRDHCPYAHNVFEYWLHPTRYRTQLCNDGGSCRRKICFFAHSLDELRVPAVKPFVSPEALAAAASAAGPGDSRRSSSSHHDSSGRPSLDSAASVASGQQAGGGAGPAGAQSLPSLVAVLDAARGQQAGRGGTPRAASWGGEEAGGGAGRQPRADPGLSAALGALQGSPGFDHQARGVVEVVASLLAQDRLAPAQASIILQQMLPSSTLELLHNALAATGAAGVQAPAYAPRAASLGSYQAAQEAQARAAAGGASEQARRSMEDSRYASLLQAYNSVERAYQVGYAPFLYQQQGSDAVPMDRDSWESSRTSYDQARARMSLDELDVVGQLNYGAALSMLQQQNAAAAAALAATQFGGGGASVPPLSPVPEGYPIVTRESDPGAFAGARGDGVERLSAEMQGLDFGPPAPQLVNAFSSSLFSGQTEDLHNKGRDLKPGSNPAAAAAVWAHLSSLQGGGMGPPSMHH
ncbi:Zinc finger CCCH domain-containing protein 24 [Auxenochlorella protothecoides]|uniref:Zinc finger CCCH domain-containing protein 24 n=1 Tax=Auxenochlorella protothecoides TaxID=3075 RepID=A0A087SES6_AUXPR|nr:Zinc finger CCCH domain-containing protein 24 [Auxenochlorella protothecoides]KFM24230.1 Zinc finger CCCH domain-containing protein 24 [Auxenochlorella protothecoides]